MVAIAKTSRDPLARLAEAAQTLAEIHDAKDVKSMMDMASLAKQYAKKMELGEDAERHAHAIWIDAKCRLGEVLSEIPNSPTGPKELGPAGGPNSESAPSLRDLQITKNTSSEAQRLAELRAEKPEIYEEVRSGKRSESSGRAALKPPKKPEPFHLLTSRGEFCDAVMQLVDKWPTQYRNRLPEALRELAAEIEESC